jgi:para-nitrobenzyl esterase
VGHCGGGEIGQGRIGSNRLEGHLERRPAPRLGRRGFEPDTLLVKNLFLELAMTKRLYILFFGLVACAPVSAQAPATAPVVSIIGGKVRGLLLPKPDGAAFLGLPFAQPPVGDLRWREPAPVKPWSGIREASDFRPSCAQIDAGWNHDAAERGSEDCLYLNVWTPEWPVSSPRAVMVWLHGGANMGGTASFGYHGTALARHDVIVVTVNYRLGILGFLAHPELAAESPHRASGNCGLLDQIAALRWVHENIAKFGGDPDRVTLFGQSAGAQDTGLLMTSPLSKGLFQRAITESGTVLVRGPVMRVRAEAEHAGKDYSAKLHAPPGHEIAYLRGLPVAEVLAASPPYGSSDGNPSIDGWVLPVQPAEIFAAGNEHRVDLIVGSNAIEFPFRGDVEAVKQDMTKVLGDAAPRALSLYGLDGKADAVSYAPYGDARDQWSSDLIFRCPAISIALQHRAAGNRVYQYEFSLPAIGTQATAHSAELPYVWGSKALDNSEGDRTVSAQMQQYWTNFAKTGDPNGPSLPKWPTFESDKRRYVEFIPKGTVEKIDLRRAQCELFQASAKASGR